MPKVDLVDGVSGPFYVVEFICYFDVKETSVIFSVESVELKVVF